MSAAYLHSSAGKLLDFNPCKLAQVADETRGSYVQRDEDWSIVSYFPKKLFTEYTDRKLHYFELSSEASLALLSTKLPSFHQ